MVIPKKLPIKTSPEAKLQAKIIEMLQAREWFVKATHGNLYQSGFPDLYACHHKYGQRWIEVKIKEHYSFTGAQLINFPRFSAAGAKIWILTDAT